MEAAALGAAPAFGQKMRRNRPTHCRQQQGHLASSCHHIHRKPTGHENIDEVGRILVVAHRKRHRSRNFLQGLAQHRLHRARDRMTLHKAAR